MQKNTKLKLSFNKYLTKIPKENWPWLKEIDKNDRKMKLNQK